MDCNLQPRPVPVVPVGIYPQQTVIRLHIAPQIGVVGPGGVDHHPSGALVVFGITAIAAAGGLGQLGLIA